MSHGATYRRMRPAEGRGRTRGFLPVACAGLLVAGLVAPSPVAIKTSRSRVPLLSHLWMGYVQDLSKESVAGRSYAGRYAAQGQVVTRGAPPVRGAMRWTFNPGPGRDTEVSLAVDPDDSDRVVVAWQEDIRRIWAAWTEDAGRNWTVELLRDPAAPPLDSPQEGFDPTARIGPDGTMYVLMGGIATPAPGVSLSGGITLARRADDAWSFHHVDDLGPPHLWDAMHLAVAPDSGDLYVVAQSIDHRGIGFWQSSDGGDSWSVLRFPQLENPQGAPRLVQDGFDYWPRVAAGPEGLVLLVTKALLSQGDQIRVTVSLDGGDTFGPVTPLTDGRLDGRLVGIPADFDGALAVAGYATDTGIAILRARRATGRWAVTRLPRPEPGFFPDWSTVVAVKRTVWVLHTEEARRPRWHVLLTRVDGESFDTTVLADMAARQPRGDRAGDEYGGLGIAPDGSVWAAWSEPAPDGPPVIAVIRMD